MLTSGLGGDERNRAARRNRRVVQERVNPALLIDQVLERVPEVRLLEHEADRLARPATLGRSS